MKLKLDYTVIKEILTLSWPIIIGQLGMVLTGFFDNLMVAKLGHQHLAAAGICNSIYFLVAVFPMGITMAYATLISILKGKNSTTSYAAFYRDAFLLTVFFAVLFFGILYMLQVNFHWFQQSVEIEILAKEYLYLLAISLIPMLIFFFAKNIADGFGLTSAGMVVTIVALIINIFLNWVLIFGNLGFESYGLNGAGYATIISRVFMAFVIAIVLLKSKKLPVSVAAFFQSFQWHPRITFYKRILNLGIPSGLQFWFEVAAFALAAIMAGWYGAKHLAAHNLAITLASLTYMFVTGVASGSSICVARYYGKSDMRQVRAFGKNAHWLGGILMTFFGLIFLIFNHSLTGLFTQDVEVFQLGSTLLYIAAIFQLSDGLQAISVSILRGIADVKIPSIITLFAYWGVAIPVSYFLSTLSYKEEILGVVGIWVGLTIGLTISAILLTKRFFTQTL